MPRRDGKGFDAALLAPVYSAFAAVSHGRLLLRMSDTVKLPAPVCSVGNITFGGTAKTPTVEYLARLMKRHGRKPGVVLRGWKGRLDRRAEPPAIVSDGKDIMLKWEDCGDEARLLAESLLGEQVPVAVGRDREGACRLLLDTQGADILLLDDGFQYVRLDRDFDMALIDSLAPFGRHDGRMGLLREPVSALSRADVILLTRAEAVEESRLDTIVSKLDALVNDHPPVLTARTLVRRILDGGTGEECNESEINNRTIAAFTGIGNPLGFESTLKGLGCEIAEFKTFPDHYPFKRGDLERIDARAGKLGAQALVTTSKDAVRLDGNRNSITLPLYVVEIELRIDDEESFARMLGESIGVVEKSRTRATTRVAPTGSAIHQV